MWSLQASQTQSCFLILNTSKDAIMFSLRPQLRTYSGYIMLVVLATILDRVSYAAGGQVNVTGNIIANTCTVLTADQEKSVSMGSVPVKQFTNGNGEASPTSFMLTFTDCASQVSGISVKFSGTPDSSNTELLSLDDDPSVASGIAIALLDSNRVRIPLKTSTAAYPLPAGSTSLTMKFYAQYVRNGLPLSAGKADATTSFTVTYE